MVVGGMYNVLESALKFLDSNGNTYFTKEEMVSITGLSDQAVSNNIVRLEKSGFLVRECYTVQGKKGRFTRYKLTCGDMNELLDIYFS